MLHYGLYEQAINNQMASEAAEISEAHKAAAPIDKAEAAKVLAQYLSDAVQKGLNNVLGNGGEISAPIKRMNQIAEIVQNTTQKLTLLCWVLTSAQSSFLLF